MEKQLLLFGLMKKAGRLSVGDEPVTDALTFGDARVAALASDAAENTVRRFTRLAEEVNVPVVQLAATKRELGESLGRATAAVVAVCDIGFAARFLELACEAEPENETLAAAREKMTHKAERLVEEQKKKRKEEKEAKKHPFKARTQPAEKTEKVEKTEKPAAVAYEKRDGDVRTYQADRYPGKVYGKAPGRVKSTASIGDRRREDAERKLEKSGGSERSNERRSYGDRKPGFSGNKSGYTGNKSGFNGKNGYKGGKSGSDRQGSRDQSRTNAGYGKSGGYQAGKSYGKRQDTHGKGGKTK